MWLITNPWIVLGGKCIGCSVIFWIMGMGISQLSFMHPFLGLNNLSIVIGAKAWLNEYVYWTWYLAVLCIGISLIYMSKGPSLKVKE